MCLALDVVRSEAAIADPTKLVIKKIIPNFISGQSFIDAATFAIGNDPQATGGFDKNADRQMIVGANRENITGCFPLYLFKEHNKIAIAKKEQIYGFLCTLDPLGFTPQQSFVVPFLVLHRAFTDLMKDKENTKLKEIYEMVFETCKHVYFKTEIALEEYKKIKSIISDPQN